MNWEYRPSKVGFHDGWWVFRDGEDLHVSITDHSEAGYYQVAKWWGILPNLLQGFGSLEEAKAWVEREYAV